jgi:outer membrane protein TolC
MRVPLLVGLSGLVVAPMAGAQGVTEEQFLSAFTGESPAVRALTEGLARAEAAQRRARTLANPRADFWREAPEANPRLVNWTVAWTPPLDGRYGLGKRAADAGVEAAQQRLSVEKAGLRRELRAAFAEWSLARERLEVVRRQLDVVHGLAEIERQRARAGEESGLSARRFTLAETEVRATAATAEAALVRAEARARAWRPDLSADTAPAPTLLPEPPTVSDDVPSPELKALALDVEQAVLEGKRAGRFVTFPTLQVGWQQLDDRGTSRTGPILAIGWTIPLFDRDQAARHESTRRQAIAQARLSLGRTRVAAEIEGSATAYRTLFAASREARGASEDADRVIAAATAAFRAGEASLTDLLDSLRAASGARIAEIDLRGQALEAHRELEAALGRPLMAGGL